jgi:hypothetical protein
MNREKMIEVLHRFRGTIFIAACLGTTALCLINSDSFATESVLVSTGKNIVTLDALSRLEKRHTSYLQGKNAKLRHALVDLQGNLEGEVHR